MWGWVVLPASASSLLPLSPRRAHRQAGCLGDGGLQSAPGTRRAVGRRLGGRAQRLEGGLAVGSLLAARVKVGAAHADEVARCGRELGVGGGRRVGRFRVGRFGGRVERGFGGRRGTRGLLLQVLGLLGRRGRRARRAAVGGGTRVGGGGGGVRLGRRARAGERRHGGIRLHAGAGGWARGGAAAGVARSAARAAPALTLLPPEPAPFGRHPPRDAMASPPPPPPAPPVPPPAYKFFDLDAQELAPRWKAAPLARPRPGSAAAASPDGVSLSPATPGAAPAGRVRAGSESGAATSTLTRARQRPAGRAPPGLPTPRPAAGYRAAVRELGAEIEPAPVEAEPAPRKRTSWFARLFRRRGRGRRAPPPPVETPQSVPPPAGAASAPVKRRRLPSCSRSRSPARRAASPRATASAPVPASPRAPETFDDVVSPVALFDPASPLARGGAPRPGFTPVFCLADTVTGALLDVPPGGGSTRALRKARAHVKAAEEGGSAPGSAAGTPRGGGGRRRPRPPPPAPTGVPEDEEEVAGVEDVPPFQGPLPPRRARPPPPAPDASIHKQYLAGVPLAATPASEARDASPPSCFPPTVHAPLRDRTPARASRMATSLAALEGQWVQVAVEAAATGWGTGRGWRVAGRAPGSPAADAAPSTTPQAAPGPDRRAVKRDRGREVAFRGGGACE